MLSRTCALWLVVLILLPFSAPFSTCDLATVFPAASRHDSADPVRAHAPIASPYDAANTHVLPFTRVTARGVRRAGDALTLAGAVASPAPYQVPAALRRSPLISPLRI